MSLLSVLLPHLNEVNTIRSSLCDFLFFLPLARLRASCVLHRWQACHILVNGFFCIVNRTAEASLEVMTSFIHFDSNNYVYVKDRRVCVRANEISGCAQKKT